MMTTTKNLKAWLRASLAACALVMLALPAAAQELIDINTATREQLEGLPGVGAKIASDIVREREENGPFTSVEDLTRVPSMTASVHNKVKNLVKVGSDGQLVIREGKVVSSEVVRKVLMRYAGEPTVREVQEQAVQYANVHPDVVSSWRGRARANALAPQLTVAAQGDIDRDLRTVSNLDATAAEIEAKDENNSGRLVVGTRWDLDRLIFEPAEMAVARETVRYANLRDRVLEEVTRRYYERRRLQVDLDLTPPTDLGDRVRKELRLQELTADLDSYTGGWFSDKLKQAGRSPY
jgi:competence ComEA-like helix-hairpin-helix protein